ncbi:MAG: hypothetical protein MUF04_05995 [Akkermansiaceae bacterium]|nr:hypothetical protein [Akkermansiaceae bacterium]
MAVPQGCRTFGIDAAGCRVVTCARMDGARILLTAAAGAAWGEAMLGARLGNRALLWGGALALAPGALDFVAGLVLRTSAHLAFSAAATHSLVVVGLAAALVPRWLASPGKKAKLSRGRIACFAALAWLTGPLLACLTVPGVQVLWPFPAPRLCADVLAPGDAMPGLLLAVPLAAMAWVRGKKKADLAKRRRLWWWGLALAGSYLVVLLAGKLWATAGFGADLARRGVGGTPHGASPTAWNPLLWRGLARRDDAVWLAHRSIWENRSTPVRWIILPRHQDAFARFADTAEARRLAATSGDWWICRPNATGLWLADLRAGEHRVWGERRGMVDLRCRRAWHFQPDGPGDPVRRLRLERQPAPEAFTRLAKRSFGDRTALDGIPRLAGVPGMLPEILATAE